MKITGTITLEGAGSDTVEAPDVPSSGGGGGLDGGNGGQDTAIQKSVTAGEFDEYLESIKDKAGTYVITLTEDLLDRHGIILETANVNITVKGDIASRKIAWKVTEDHPYSLFWVKAGKLTLESINLSRAAGNTQDIPFIGTDGGTIEIKNGVVLNNSINVDVLVLSGGFIMSGGTIDGVWLVSGSFTMSGGTMNGEAGGEGNGISITISGGTINGALRIWGSGNSIAMSGGSIKDNIFIYSDDSTVSISGGTITSNGGGSGVAIEGSGNVVRMTGGEISVDRNQGVLIFGTNNKFIMSGGTIKNNGYNGIYFSDDSENCTVEISGSAEISGNGKSDIGGSGVTIQNGSKGNTLTISGGTIKDNDNGISFHSKNFTLKMTGGTIKDNKGSGIEGYGENIVLDMTGGTISGNKDGAGIVIWDGENCSVNVSGGTISDNHWHGVAIGGTGSMFTMSGGVISKNGSWGLTLSGSNTGFEKKTGAIIYGGDSGANKNGAGAIFVDLNDDDKNLYRFEDAASNVLYAAKINVAGDGIVPDSQKPATW